MNDDYLWDGSGEPDAEVQRLESMLSSYRYQPKALSPTLVSPLSSRRSQWIRYAAAAAILIVVAGLWFWKLQSHRAANQEQVVKVENPPESPTPSTNIPDKLLPAPENRVAASPPVKKPAGIIHRRPLEIKNTPDEIAVNDSAVVAERRPIIIPFIDVETGRHLEQAQLLLRSFRNDGESNDMANADLVYDRARSRTLLSKNIVLRRDAEARGNIPAENLLSQLEPFLLDIANLPDRSSAEEVRSIKQRMHKTEILSALQIYSAPTLARNF